MQGRESAWRHKQISSYAYKRGAQTPDDVLGLVNGEGAGCHDLLSSKSERTPCCHSASIVLNSFPAVGSFILGGLRRGPRTSCFSGRSGIYCVVTTRHHLSFLSQTSHFRVQDHHRRSSILRSVLNPLPRGGCSMCADLPYSLTGYPIGTPYFDDGFDSTWVTGF